MHTILLLEWPLRELNSRSHDENVKSLPLDEKAKKG